MGLLYFPPVLQFLWGLESTSLGLLWCFIQIFFGVALYSKEWQQIRNFILLINLIYQLVWSFLIVDHIVNVHDRFLGIAPYLLHLVLVLGIGWYYILRQVKRVHSLS
jgi:hypothetical protein